MTNEATLRAVIDEISRLVTMIDADILVKSLGSSEQRAQANALQRWKTRIEAELRKAEKAPGRYEVGG